MSNKNIANRLRELADLIESNNFENVRLNVDKKDKGEYNKSVIYKIEVKGGGN